MSEKSASVMRYGEFAQDPESVINTIHETGEPIAVTAHGRFLFLVEPLASGEPHEDTTDSNIE